MTLILKREYAKQTLVVLGLFVLFIRQFGNSSRLGQTLCFGAFSVNFQHFILLLGNPEQTSKMELFIKTDVSFDSEYTFSLITDPILVPSFFAETIVGR